MSVLPPVSSIGSLLSSRSCYSQTFLARFRSLSRRAMQLVNSVRQYTPIIKHCHIIHAIVSIQADAFDCATLYRTLFTTQFPLPDIGWQKISWMDVGCWAKRAHCQWTFDITRRVWHAAYEDISSPTRRPCIYSEIWQKYADKLTFIIISRHSGDGLPSPGANFHEIHLSPEDPKITAHSMVGDVNMFLKKGDHLSTASEDLQRAFLTQISLASAPLKN